MTYHHLFGPVASRRLGVSLGVDLVVHKVCSLDCIYCECGKTTELTDQRRAWVPYERVITELDHYLAHNPDPDYITFSGSGEPTLSRDIGKVIAHIKQIRPSIRVAVLTNTTLMSDPGVRRELLQADLVVPSLDGASSKVFNTVNRPFAADTDPISPDRMIRGIRDFVREFAGEVYLEIFIVPGVNDTPEELERLRKAVEKICPHRVQLNSLDRPGTEPGLIAAARENLERIRTFFGPERTEIIARVPERARTSRKAEDLEAAVLETIHRRPCTCEDLASILGVDPSVVRALLDRLEQEGKALSRQEARGRFFQTRKD